MSRILIIEANPNVLPGLRKGSDVWGHGAAVMTRTVDYHIPELRRKRDADSGRPQHILTVRKAGYRV